MSSSMVTVLTISPPASASRHQVSLASVIRFIVTQGQITQFIELESTTLATGDSVYIDEGVVHASYNDGADTAQLQVVIGPALGAEGYGLVDVAGEEPWASVR